VPKDFRWAYYNGESFDSETKNRPLAFLAQFDLAEISRYDTDNVLPKTGVLSFFYELETMKWGYDPKDKGCARVFWFEDAGALSPAEFPKDLEDYLRFPEIGISAKIERSYQGFEDFLVQREKMAEQWEAFEDAEKSLGIYSGEDPECSKLLGWANVIQGNMTRECELVSRGYYLGRGWENVTPRDRQETEQWANRDWLLLFQLDTVRTDGFELMFGDCGRIYFYIRRDDLAARDFDNVWLILQCC
ncbi:MAG: YwqG family protein, partial [Ruminococcus sp.]|nr:YwqG family protein [Ruminococcus sp.]